MFVVVVALVILGALGVAGLITGSRRAVMDTSASIPDPNAGPDPTEPGTDPAPGERAG